MKNSTKILLIISHLSAFSICMYVISMMYGFNFDKGNYALEIIVFFAVCAIFFTLFYLLFKNLKLYLSLTILFYLFISPIFFMLLYEVVTSIYYSIMLKDLSVLKDSGFQIYFLCSILYLIPIITSINLKLKNTKHRTS